MQTLLYERIPKVIYVVLEIARGDYFYMRVYC